MNRGFKLRILYVTTISNTANAFLIPHIKELHRRGHNIDCAFNIQREPEENLKDVCNNIYNIPFKRSPLKKDNLKAYKKIKKLILEEKYDVVHTHTPVASMIVRIACRRNKNIKVMYTAHGFHFFKGAPLKNWILYYPVEKYLSKYTNVLITINTEDYSRAKAFFKAEQTKYIPGMGLDIKSIQNKKVDRNAVRKELQIPKNSYLILSVGELNNNKNHRTVLKAISQLKNKDIFYIICGTGILEKELKKMASELGLNKNFKLLGFRKDIISICKSSDLFIFPSKREGLGLAALEAIASGLPVITSNIHGIVDYSVEGVTGFSHNPMDVKSISQSIKEMYENPNLTKQISQQNHTIIKKYDIDNVIEQSIENHENLLKK